MPRRKHKRLPSEVPAFQFFYRLPSVLIEKIISYVNIPDALNASRSSKDLRACVLTVLARDVKVLTFRLIPRPFKIPACVIARRFPQLVDMSILLHVPRFSAACRYTLKQRQLIQRCVGASRTSLYLCFIVQLDAGHVRN